MKELLWFKVKHVNQVKPKNLLSWLLCDLPVNTNMNSQARCGEKEAHLLVFSIP